MLKRFNKILYNLKICIISHTETVYKVIFCKKKNVGNISEPNNQDYKQERERERDA